MPVNQTCFAILITYHNIICKGKKHYCVPHPNSILQLLDKYHKIIIHRRWLFQCERNLEEQGFIRRQRRWKHLQDNEIRSDSSIWVLTLKGAQFLASKMVAGASNLANMIRAWLKGDDKRFPNNQSSEESDVNIGHTEDLKKLLAKIGTPF